MGDLKLKLPSIPIPNGKVNGNRRAIVSRSYCYIQFIDGEHNVRNSIYVERRRHRDGSTTYMNRSFVIKRRVSAKSPHELLRRLNIKYKPKSVRVVKA